MMRVGVRGRRYDGAVCVWGERSGEERRGGSVEYVQFAERERGYG